VVSDLHYHSFHHAYKQTPDLYETIGNCDKDSFIDEWKNFLHDANSKNGLITGGERVAYYAELNGLIVGAGAISSYVEGKWPNVDKVLAENERRTSSVAKVQNLYIDPDYQRLGIGSALKLSLINHIARKGYETVFTTTYADSEGANTYQSGNNLQLVDTYESMQTFENGKRAQISCFVGDLEELQDHLKERLGNINGMHFENFPNDNACDYLQNSM
ncbi:MAG: GNAT family N-acetyltransferase, partial [Gammaproteobacteria bacterium]|nr:GNAT family N-acetyltransferase [Gammaproteobacteria bacterium]